MSENIIINNKLTYITLEEIYLSYSKYMINIAYRILESKEDAEDALHNSFISLSKNLKIIRELKDYQLVMYLKMAIKNASLDIIRKRKKIIFIEDLKEDLDSYIDIEKQVIQKEEISLVFEALGKLDVKYKDILYLHFIAELKTRDISKLLNKPYNTVRSNLQRGKEKLMEILEKGSK